MSAEAWRKLQEKKRKRLEILDRAVRLFHTRFQRYYRDQWEEMKRRVQP